MLITILYDNRAIDRRGEPDWGFAALIEIGRQKILFDTGGDPEVLAINLQKFKVDLKKIDAIVLSHQHWDHVNGLPVVLNPRQKVFLLKSFPQELKSLVVEHKAQLVEIDRSREIFKDVYTTGPLKGKVDEQALVFDLPQGVVLLAGCSHPWIVDMVKLVKDKFQKPVNLVLGGFHLYPFPLPEVKTAIKQLKTLGIQKIAPCHCTGDKAMRLFEKEFGLNFLSVGVGSKIQLNA